MKSKAALVAGSAAAGVGMFGLMMIAGLGGSNSSGSTAATSQIDCVAGASLRAGSVPNGWETDILAAAEASGVPPAILAAQIETESNWNPDAQSPVGAQGLTQFMPGTWDAYGVGDPFDPLAAITAQGKYMGTLLASVTPIAKKTGGDPVVYALAAYNAGPARIEQYQGVPPFKETQNYVAKIPDLAQTKFAADCAATGQSGGDGVKVGPGEWTTPLPGGILTSTFGQRWGVLHAGVDLATPKSQPPGDIIAVTDLLITWAGDKGDGYGQSVVGRTVDGTDIQMRFGHMATGTLTVKAGQKVKAGTKLGVMGSTGDSTGAHLHFEIYAAGAPQNAYASNGTPVDPLPILQSKGIVL